MSVSMSKTVKPIIFAWKFEIDTVIDIIFNFLCEKMIKYLFLKLYIQNRIVIRNC